MSKILEEVTGIRLSKSKGYFNYFKFEKDTCFILNNDRWEPYQGACNDIRIIGDSSKPKFPIHAETPTNFLHADVIEYIPVPVLRELLSVYKDKEADRISLNITLKYEKELSI